MLICDTGVLVSAAIVRDPDHRACVDLLTGARLARRRLVVPAPVVAGKRQRVFGELQATAGAAADRAEGLWQFLDRHDALPGED